MEKRIIKISFGRTRQYDNYKLSLPTRWIREMGFTEDDREVEVAYDYDNKTITIKKKA